ncbi:LuxR C-terminal-related transcriptional regulator [Nocardia sp. NPDC005825]|uniref:helix-turn-helix domain-containing protein n=1 Tax=unclassified Nocardia TaxID=2637762 RepID=UPI0033CAE048
MSRTHAQSPAEGPHGCLVAEARAHLRHALDIFDRLGADAHADQVRIALCATHAGTRPAPDAVATRRTPLDARLTPQELRVVRLAVTGATNKQIAARLFLSHKTVGHHLYRAFRKLGIRNRIELTRFDFS